MSWKNFHKSMRKVVEYSGYDEKWVSSSEEGTGNEK